MLLPRDPSSPDVTSVDSGQAKKILIAMSGGVDSSVAAALLKNQDYDVTGVFIFFQPLNQVKKNYEIAKEVAEHLNIPFHTLDMTIDFNKLIVNPFIQEYKNGCTPNPCIRCNKYLKFGRLLDKACQLGCDYLATGHYAQTLRHKNKKTKKHCFKLITARDKTKDQSYFLYELTQDQLKHILFPLGDYTKNQVRQLAKKFNLPVDVNRESSDVCFISADLRRFLKSQINADKGDVVNTAGRKVGEHEGLPFYTLGQRQGIKIGGTGPYYVVEKDFNKNQLIVTNNPHDSQLFKNKLKVKDINWISGFEPKLPFVCWARDRCQSQLAKVKIIRTQSEYLVKFEKHRWAVTPGQSIVFYKPTRVVFNHDYEILGGGIIC